jgi:hypothetical protein
MLSTQHLCFIPILGWVINKLCVIVQKQKKYENFFS